MFNANEIQEGMPVRAKSVMRGEQQSPVIGTVDRVEANQIKLKRSHSPDGQHRFVPVEFVESVENGEVILNSTAEDVVNAQDDHLKDAML